MSAPAPQTPRVFVSHSHHDNAYCRDYVTGLRNAGLHVWYDEHNLGWGALRQAIEREMAEREHFIAILSPAAVASEWVNAEIDGALDLLRDGTLKTFLLVLAAPCTVPLLLRRYKRVEGPGGTPVSVAEAVGRTVSILVPTLPVVATGTPKVSIPPERFPKRLADLGFVARGSPEAEHIVPPLCVIPSGPFLMGSKKEDDAYAYDDELPQHSVMLSAYQIGTHPVTVAEYACAVRASAVQSLPGWQEQLRKLELPIVNVSWVAAVAYATWLSVSTGDAWRLPSEAEWEKAVRGTDGRIYPWGDDRDGSDALCSHSFGATPVGNFSGGASPFGVQDLLGNIWEWTSSLERRYPYISDDGRENPNSNGSRVLRGGQFYSGDLWMGRAACRGTHSVGRTFGTVGFRLART